MLKKEQLKVLGETIQNLREEIGLTQEDVSRETGIQRATISKWENGQLEPRLSHLTLLAERVFECHVDELIKEYRVRYNSKFH